MTEYITQFIVNKLFTQIYMLSVWE